MSRLLIACLVWVAIGMGGAFAQVTMTRAGNGTPASGFVASCSQSSAFIARATGIGTYTTYETAMDTLICGGVTDGWYAKLDEFYIFAAPTQTMADLNIISSSYTVVPSGTLTFDPMFGYTGDASSGVLTTGNFSGGGTNYTQNSASIGGCIMEKRTNPNAGDYLEVMYTAGTNATINVGFSATLNTGWQINNSGSNVSFANGASVQGIYQMNRTASNAAAIYYNCASTSCSSTSSVSTASVGVPNTTLKWMSSGADSIGWGYAGSALTSTNMYNMRTRMQTYMSTVANWSGC